MFCFKLYIRVIYLAQATIILTTHYKPLLVFIYVLSIINDSFSQAPDWAWAKSFGSTSYDTGHSIAVDAAGNVYTTGSFNRTVDFDPGPGTFNLTSAGDSDIFILKLDPSGHFIWAKQMGGAGHDAAFSIALDHQGNIYTTGTFELTADFNPDTSAIFNLNSQGNADIFVSKLDSAGNFIWAKSMGGADYDFASSIALDAEGNVYTTGFFKATGDYDPGVGTYYLNLMGYNDMFISKLDTAGNFVWAKSFSASNGVYGNSITVDALGNVYTTGDFQGSADFDPGVGVFILGGFAGDNVFISKLDSAGNFVWAKQIGGATGNSATGWSIAVDAVGNVFTVGSFHGSPDFDPGPGLIFMFSIGGTDVFILKLNSAGNFVWAKQIGGSSADYSYSIALDSYASVYTTGFYMGTVDFDPGPGGFTLTSGSGYPDIFISKLDSSGNFVWAKGVNGTGYAWDYGRSIAVDAFKNVYAAGEFDSHYIAFDTINLVGTNADTTYFPDIYIGKIECAITSTTLNPVACNSYTSPSGNYTWTSSGTYMDTVRSQLACDSNFIINLTIASSTTSSQSIAACDHYISPSGIYFWTNSGNYNDTISNALGCDSVLTINLTINNATMSSQTITACKNCLSPSGNYTWAVSGIYTDTIINSIGCDSILTINLTINHNTTSTRDVRVCNNYLSPSGNYYWTHSGTYLDTISNAGGCDSLMTINLIVNAVNTSLTQNGSTLTANAGGAIYQWLDCDNGFAPLSGDTNQVFTASVDGNYAVVITQNGCTDTSACYTITGVGIAEISLGNNFEIFPNPAFSHFIIALKNYNRSSQLSIRDITGKIIYSTATMETQKIEVSTKDFAQGVYLVQIQTADFIETRKVAIVK